jgi:hypothetical protein
MSATTASTASTRLGIDPRGPRLTAALTAAVLLTVLLVPRWPATVLTAVQLLLFGAGATLGVQRTPHAWVFRAVVRPALDPPRELEDPKPPRFAQAVGLAFTAVALVSFLAGVTLVAQIAIGLALVAALLNAVFGFCLGCEIYLLLKRVSPAEPTVVNFRTERRNNA